MTFISKVIGIISDGPALPTIFIVYGIYVKTWPVTFIAYMTFMILLQEFFVKKIFHRHRPLTAGNRPGLSFPSTHAFTSGMVFVITFLFNFQIASILIVIAFINLINRVMLGVHYVSDVVAGFTLGLLAGCGWLLILRIVTVALP